MLPLWSEQLWINIVTKILTLCPSSVRLHWNFNSAFSSKNLYFGKIRLKEWIRKETFLTQKTLLHKGLLEKNLITKLKLSSKYYSNYTMQYVLFSIYYFYLFQKDLIICCANCLFPNMVFEKILVFMYLKIIHTSGIDIF